MSAETLRQAAEVLRDGGVNRLTANVGIALADWLESEVREAEWREGQQEHMNATRLRPEPFPVYYDRTTEKALTVARMILGGES